MHYSEGQWADFIRGLQPAGMAAEMQLHLNTGCAECGGLVARLSAVQGTLAQDQRFAVPEELIRRAVAIFRPQDAPSWRSLPRQLATLLFDSSAQPALAGARSAGAGPRHSSYELAPYRVDVRVERPHRSAPLTLTGQISSLAPGGAPVSGISVHVLGGDHAVAETSTSEFGEFQFDAAPKGAIKLIFVLDNGSRAMEVDLGSTPA